MPLFQMEKRSNQLWHVRKKKNPFVANHLWEKKRKGQDEGGERNNSDQSARTPDHLCPPILSRPKWNGSLSYDVPWPESPCPLLSARNPANTTLGPSPPFYADPSRGSLFGKPIPTALMARLACQQKWEFSRSLVKKGLVGCGIYSTRSGMTAPFVNHIAQWDSRPSTITRIHFSLSWKHIPSSFDHSFLILCYFIQSINYWLVCFIIQVKAY
jgi:hypothetical protein